MRKDEILTLRERVLRLAAAGIGKKRIPAPEPDARLYPREIGGELFWIDRLTDPAWPHAGYGTSSSPTPGLRYEIWYFQKRESSLLALLCEDRPVLTALLAALSPVFAAFVEEGRYARRYRAVGDGSPESDLILRVEPKSVGIWRAAPQSEEKLARTLETLVVDTHPRIDGAVRSVDPDGLLPRRYAEAAHERDPLDELKARFNAPR